MDEFKSFINDNLNWIFYTKISFIEALEILFLAFLVYHLLIWVRSTRAWILFRGVIVIALFYLFALILNMNVILWIFSKTINVGIILLMIVFQPELRRALEKLGQKNIVSSIFYFDDQKDKNERFSNHTIQEIVTATYEMASVKTGALIVIERDVFLGEYERTGIELDASISSQLIINIFEHNTPLHDGAVLVRNDKIVAATCYLPLSDNINLSKELGTRHRAGVGVSEVSDSLTIIVSEETGKVSVAFGGSIERNIERKKLERRLESIQKKTPDVKKSIKEFKGLKEMKSLKDKGLKGWLKNEKKDTE